MPKYRDQAKAGKVSLHVTLFRVGLTILLN